MKEFEKNLIINEQIDNTIDRIRLKVLPIGECVNCVEKSVVPRDSVGEDIAYLQALIYLRKSLNRRSRLST